MIFDKQVARKPDHYPWANEFVEAMWDSFWTPAKFDFAKDKHDFLTVLTPAERGVVTRTLVAISQVEIAVKKFWARLGDHLPHPSLTDLGMTMANSEVIHNRAYEKLLTVLGLEGAFEEMLADGVFSRRVAYLQKHVDKPYSDDRKNYVLSLVLFTLFTEAVSLFSQFYVMLGFSRHQHVLRDLAQQVAYTKCEEALHAAVGVRLVNQIRLEHPELFDDELAARVGREAQAAFAAEAGVIDWVLGGHAAAWVDAPLLKAFVAGRLNDGLAACGFARPFEPDPAALGRCLWFEEEVWAPAATDFFAKDPVDYSKAPRAVSAADLFG
jgi:ribonucleoside-diphosphate reductase beta chain